MVKPDPILTEEQRTEKALATDRLQEQLVAQRQRVFAVTFWLVVLAETGLWYFGVDAWMKLVLPLLWIGFLIHNNALLVLHELWEVNDQLSGRKDELKSVISARN